ncbi:MAG: hypothetical protein SVU88_02860 [Candidatus Nanohaloarchaea archaeon]|nr:hypothetical protein [Candidatus Nanohaloarchaea archaeon]
MFATDDLAGLRRALSRDGDDVPTGAPLVWIRDQEAADEEYGAGERFHVMYRPARSDVSTTVPNGRFGDIDDAAQYARSTVY